MTATAHYEYPVRPGEKLDDILLRLYGWSSVTHSAMYPAAIKGILEMNPHISNPNRIATGKILRLPLHPVHARGHILRGMSLAQRPLVTESVERREERERLSALAWLAHNSNWLTVPGSLATGAASTLLGPGNRQLLADISDQYAEFKAGRITRTSYQAKRAAKLAEFRQNIGPLFERMLYPKGGVASALRGGAKVLPSTLSRSQVDRLRRLAKITGRGGVLLTGIGITAACAQIAHTASQREKNEIFVETVASTVASAAVGVGLSLYLISNPVGWGPALVLATASTGASLKFGEFITKVYDSEFREMDLVNDLGVDRVCKF